MVNNNNTLAKVYRDDQQEVKNMKTTILLHSVGTFFHWKELTVTIDISPLVSLNHNVVHPSWSLVFLYFYKVPVTCDTWYVKPLLLDKLLV